jgi:hypothetical protein
MSLQLPPPIKVDTVLGAFDSEARAAAREASQVGVAAVRRTFPARTGRARAGQRGSVRRTPTGYTVQVAPSSRVRYANGVTAVQVTRWLELGTGVHGPRGRPIRPRRASAFRLPHGWVADELQGQAAQHPYQRAHTAADAVVERTLGAGVAAGVRAAERILGGR